MIREINKEVLKRKEFKSEIFQTLDALLIRLQKTKLSHMNLRPMFRFFLSIHADRRHLTFISVL